MKKKLNSSKNREAGKLAVNLLSPQAWYYFTIFKANQAIKNMLIGTSDFPVGLQTFMWFGRENNLRLWLYKTYPLRLRRMDEIKKGESCEMRETKP